MNTVQKVRIRGWLLVLVSIGMAYIGLKKHFATINPNNWGYVLTMASMPVFLMGIAHLILIRRRRFRRY